MFAKPEPARLNVEDKNRSNLFNWRGQFTPQFVDYLLETYTRPGQRVLDPFCGSGTVLQEAAARCLAATGLEINPAAYAMAKFFSLSGLNPSARGAARDAAGDALYSITATMGKELPLFHNANEYRENAANLLDVAQKVLAQVADKRAKLLLLLTFFRAESSKNGNLAATLTRAFQFLSKQLTCLPFVAEAPAATLADARNAHLYLKQQVDAIITSPPYINVFNYHQNYRALLELFGFDMLHVARSEIGANRKHRGNRFLTVIQYCLDLELALRSFAQTLTPNGLLIMVVGRESRVRGVPFGNSALAKALLQNSGAFSAPDSYERVFVNRFGQNIFEDILVARRINETRTAKSAREVAAFALRQSLDGTAGEVRADIEATLAQIDAVKPSPIFNKNALL
jgi:DNA modification methylase